LAPVTPAFAKKTPYPTVKTLRTALVLTGLAFAAASSHAQIFIPVSNVGLAFPAVVPVTLKVGLVGTVTEDVLPTPFLLTGFSAQSLTWFCMDPLQRIYYNGSGLPAGSNLVYDSNNPANFDLWAPGAPGLTTSRIQDLADLFTAYIPTISNQLVAGALQLAIWEITNEFNGNPYDLATGQMQVLAYGGNPDSASMIATAQGMLNSLSAPSIHNHGDTAELSFLIDGTFAAGRDQPQLVQDLVGFRPVPEPATYGAMGVGLLGVAVALRRRSRVKVSESK
jgi:hypothetical protein